MRALVAALWLVTAACGTDRPSEPVDVTVLYVSRLPDGCPSQASPCYPGCVHHNAPAGLQVIVPLWAPSGSPPVRLSEVGPRRYQGLLTDVPADTRLRLYARDIGACCVEACTFEPVLEDVYLNGTRLTHVVREGLPAGVAAALEFSVTGTGAVRN